MKKWLPLVLVSVILPMSPTARAAEPALLRSGERVMFLGDSITMDGRFLISLDLLTRSRLAAPAPELINLGLASETVSGLSEKEHPWPRPSVMERLDRALEKGKPQVVVACYGMNDGIYAPFSEERWTAFITAYETLSAKVRKTGARLVIVTPPPFDAESYGGAMRDDGPGSFGYQAAFRGYDGVLAEYSARLLRRADLADRIIDAHTPMDALFTAMRAADPGWKSGDGIHPDAGPHAALAAVLAAGLGLPDSPGTVTVSAPAAEGVITVKVDTVPPVPAPGPGVRPLLDRAGFSTAMNRLTLTVPNADEPVYRLKNGERLLGIFSAGALARGLDLTALDSWEPVRAAAEVLPAAEARHRLLGGAWREYVGHTRPDTDRNFPPLEEALRKAAEYEATLDAVMRRRETYTLTLEPVR